MSGVPPSYVAFWGEYRRHSICSWFYIPITRFGVREGTNGMSNKKWITINGIVYIVPESYVSQEHRKSVVGPYQDPNKWMRTRSKEIRRRLPRGQFAIFGVFEIIENGISLQISIDIQTSVSMSVSAFP
jgi:hypothetical protein